MAKNTPYLSVDPTTDDTTLADAGGFWSDFWNVAKAVLTPLASLKITVVLFLMAIFIVYTGTLAQTEKDIWQVIHDYFRMDLSSIDAAMRSAFAWIDFRVFFPRSFFPNMEPIPWNYGFYFPSGWLIGLALFINLAAAHLVRFRIQAKGKQLFAGLFMIIVGCIVTAMVIMVGSYQTADLPQVFVDWPSLRILWLLTQCTVAALVLLVGCYMVFRKRAGIVLLHAGIGLLMFGELLVGIAAVESQMQITEGQTVNFAMDTRELEVAITDSSNKTDDEIFAIPQSRLESNVTIDDKVLPVDVELVKFMENSQLRRATRKDKNLATAGSGLMQVAVEIRPISGTDAARRNNHPTAYVKFLDKQSGKSLGVYRLSMQDWMRGRSEKLRVGGHVLAVQLRYKHIYTPYSMHLVNVEQQVYMGTQMAKSYASEIRLVDTERDVDRIVRIWMNNPLRYSGATFYQSSYGTDPATHKEYTGLQVVTNTGWRIPYVSCMIVTIGMLAQFWMTLGRFLKGRRASRLSNAESAAFGGPARVETTRRGAAKRAAVSAQPAKSIWNWAVPLVIVLVCASWLASKARQPSVPPTKIDFAAFGRLPITYEGRIKPIDTLARTSLRKISDRQTYIDADGKRQEAIRWLLDLITGSDAARQHKVFRIHNLDVLETLGLERRQGFRYALDEFAGQMDTFNEQVRRAHSMKPEHRDLYARKVLDLERRLNEFWMLQEAFQLPQLRMEHAREDISREANRRERYARFSLPLAVPSLQEGKPWQAYTFALFDALAQRMATTKGMQTTEPNKATLALLGILTSYDAEGKNAATFNQKVREYQKLLDDDPPANWDQQKTRFEVSFNHAAPLYYAMILYLLAAIIGCFAWFGWTVTLQRSSTWLCLFTLVVHTLALIARMYISGRPPITTLYTSALFVGWSCVVLGLLMEWYSKIGVANVVAATTGFIALLIAYKLTTGVDSFKGDTFTVLMAVLDTNFWLATHVTCVTAGYGATFFAGFLGIVYVVRGVFTPSLTRPVAKEVGRMIYGTICFAIFFSFFGTVLGGLWADDSWGRFWGWDPKENGALIIVLWNAVVLHAYWARLVKERGLALMAIGGNIVTAWSWFGVNELGVGLHSYGFTEGVLLVLGIIVTVQLALIALGLVPLPWWRSDVTGER